MVPVRVDCSFSSLCSGWGHSRALVRHCGAGLWWLRGDVVGLPAVSAFRVSGNVLFAFEYVRIGLWAACYPFVSLMLVSWFYSWFRAHWVTDCALRFCTVCILLVCRAHYCIFRVLVPACCLFIFALGWLHRSSRASRFRGRRVVRLLLERLGVVSFGYFRYTAGSARLSCLVLLSLFVDALQSAWPTPQVLGVRILFMDSRSPSCGLCVCSLRGSRFCFFVTLVLACSAPFRVCCFSGDRWVLYLLYRRFGRGIGGSFRHTAGSARPLCLVLLFLLVGALRLARSSLRVLMLDVFVFALLSVFSMLHLYSIVSVSSFLASVLLVALVCWGVLLFLLPRLGRMIWFMRFVRSSGLSSWSNS